MIPTWLTRHYGLTDLNMRSISPCETNDFPHEQLTHGYNFEDTIHADETYKNVCIEKSRQLILEDVWSLNFSPAYEPVSKCKAKGWTVYRPLFSMVVILPLFPFLPRVFLFLISVGNLTMYWFPQWRIWPYRRAYDSASWSQPPVCSVHSLCFTDTLHILESRKCKTYNVNHNSSSTNDQSLDLRLIDINFFFQLCLTRPVRALRH